MSGGSCDPRALGSKSSLWDLLQPELQHYILAQSRYLLVKKKFELLCLNPWMCRPDLTLRPIRGSRRLFREMYELVNGLCTNEQYLEMLPAKAKHEMVNLQAAFSKQRQT
jgi:hypothetical protein